MRLDNKHLCYSLNVFPSNPVVQERISHIGEKFNRIRKLLKIGNEVPFALGFWADAVFTEQMRDEKNLNSVKNFLLENNFYIFTVNAFPYGNFHSVPVKTKVYQPDWTTEKRALFTCQAADFLSELLPENITGSISTLPGGYKSFLEEKSLHDSEKKIAENLLKVAEYLENIEKETGKRIILGMEMEPDCLWESTDQFISFFRRRLSHDSRAEKYIGVCYDTAHQELLEGNTHNSNLDNLLENRIKIAKVQFSKALRIDDMNTASDLLAPFADKIYLHQTRFFNKQGKIIQSYPDIPDIQKMDPETAYLISHFHLPIFLSGKNNGISAAGNCLESLLKRLKTQPEICQNLEIETYTYSVLPDSLSTDNKSIEKNIAEEYKWVLDSI